jgi:hypothetical protein
MLAKHYRLDGVARVNAISGDEDYDELKGRMLNQLRRFGTF